MAGAPAGVSILPVMSQEVPGRRGPGAVRRGLTRLPTAWRRALVAAVVLRAVIGLASLAFGGLVPSSDPVDVHLAAGQGRAGASPAEQGWGLVLGALERWDALWYLALAEHGYPDAAATTGIPEAYAFFPLLPLLTRIVAYPLLGHHLLAANLIALAATVAGLAGVHRLVEVETGDTVLAGRALTAVAVFPAAYFLVAPYTEALFLALTAWALVAARRDRWPTAALLGLAAGLTRPVAALLAVGLAAEVVRQRREGRRSRRPIAALAAVTAAPAGTALFAAWTRLATGTWTAPLEAQRGWAREWTWPHETLHRAVELAVVDVGAYPAGYQLLDLLLLVPVAAAVVWLVLRTPPTYGLYAAAHLLLWLVTPWLGRPLMSTYRFALALAPLGWAFGAWTRRGSVAAVWWAVSAALLGAMALAFVAWYFVF